MHVFEPDTLHSQTYQSANIRHAEIHVPTCTVFRTDRKEKSNGGVARYIRENATVLLLLTHSNVVCDTLLVYLKQNDVVISILYHLPDASNYDATFKECLTKIIEVLINLDQGINVLLLGNFNFPNIRWPEDVITSGLA